MWIDVAQQMRDNQESIKDLQEALTNFLLKLVKLSNNLRYFNFNYRLLDQLIDLNSKSYVPLCQLILVPLSFTHMAYFNQNS